VLDADFPDPAVLEAADGWYYAYATQGGPEGAMANIQAARSRDLVAWERLPDVLPVKPAWASRRRTSGPRTCTRRADATTSTTRQARRGADRQGAGALPRRRRGAAAGGPFTDSGRPLQCGPGFVNIDPMAYDDPATGKRLLYWGSGFGPIKVQELAADRISFAAGSAPVDLVQPVKTDDPNEYRRLVEGAWVTRRDGWYYLFYSGDNCCGPKAHYAALAARSRSATGPFEAPAERIVVERGGIWVAPGHNSIVEDSAAGTGSSTTRWTRAAHGPSRTARSTPGG
jgi:arabinan endo-1,5-alpha-L-arabinosidase